MKNDENSVVLFLLFSIKCVKIEVVLHSSTFKMGGDEMMSQIAEVMFDLAVVFAGTVMGWIFITIIIPALVLWCIIHWDI